MLKDGYKHLSGLEEAVIKNIEACKALSQITRTSLGPHGMNKMVINHLERLFVTSDAATILNELEVQHPAAKLVALAAKSQQEELGDGTNLVVSLAGELMSHADELIREGLHPSEIIEGYVKASEKVLQLLPTLVLPGSEKIDVMNETEVATALKASIASKQYGYEDLLAPLVAKACIEVCPPNPNNFNVDNVRVCKVTGGGIHNSTVVNGLVIKRDTEGTVKAATDAKVAVYADAVDTLSTETKGTVLIESAEQLETYSKSEEDKMEAYIKGIADAGAKVVVSGGSFGEMALHFIERYGLMAVKIVSKFELRRFCRATGAVGLVKAVPPSADELGYIKDIRVEEYGDTIVTVIRQDEKVSKIATLLLRASTDNMLDNIERALDDGVNSYKILTRDPRRLPAGGATELELARLLSDFGKKETGLDQYAVKKFATALEIVPRILCENAGMNPEQILPQLYAAHASGSATTGVDIEENEVKDLTPDGYCDLYDVKYWAIKLCVEAVVTVLRVDQIIMAKQAGGPKAGNKPAMDED